MSETLHVVYLARHGETAWSLSCQHTGLTNLPLTDRGERNARKLGEQLRGRSFAPGIYQSFERAARTCALAGLGAQANIDVTCLNGTTASTRVHAAQIRFGRDFVRQGDLTKRFCPI